MSKILPMILNDSAQAQPTPVNVGIRVRKDGGQGSGNFGHAGRAGEVGGSGSGGGKVSGTKAEKQASNVAAKMGHELSSGDRYEILQNAYKTRPSGSTNAEMRKEIREYFGHSIGTSPEELGRAAEIKSQREKAKLGIGGPLFK